MKAIAGSTVSLQILYLCNSYFIQLYRNVISFVLRKYHMILVLSTFTCNQFTINY